MLQSGGRYDENEVIELDVEADSWLCERVLLEVSEGSEDEAPVASEVRSFA